MEYQMSLVSSTFPYEYIIIRKSGRNGLMWEVLPCYEFLFNHLKRLMEQYWHDPDEDLKLNIQLGWQKLNEYYTKLDDTEIYVAAVALHPQLQLTKRQNNNSMTSGGSTGICHF
ncbi:hypothetical protein LZL87_014034 [Fusarium oxysporum]|nr:hypothetical protein LZL87_014034 [Fusarium oxysporum]